ncbi:MAG: hypothetical protein KDC71_05310 [Acidobacteria bacterium]|nr:hypothetical protein [Acidobacteriota bacterium]
MNQPWLNLQTYHWPMMSLFLAGCVLWVVVYVLVIKKIRQRQFVEIPLIGVTANIGWEFIWSFIFQPDMGKLVLIGYAAWFFLDCYIFYSLLKYGYKQLQTPALIKHSKLLIVGLTIAWAAIIITLETSGYDTPIGTISAYWDNLVFSAAYVLLALTLNDKTLLSKAAGWCKGLGTGLISIAVCIQWPDNQFLKVICILTASLDALYLYLLHRVQSE